MEEQFKEVYFDQYCKTSKHETKLSTGLEATFTTFVKVSKDVMMTILGIKDSVLDICPNKRVVHLAKHGSKKTRKKNFRRAIRILEER